VAGLLHLEDFLDPGDHLVGAGIRRLVYVDSTHSELALYGRDERWSLEEGTAQLLQTLTHLGHRLHGSVELEYGHILFASALLGLD